MPDGTIECVTAIANHQFDIPCMFLSAITFASAPTRCPRRLRTAISLAGSYNRACIRTALSATDHRASLSTVQPTRLCQVF